MKVTSNHRPHSAHERSKETHVVFQIMPAFNGYGGYGDPHPLSSPPPFSPALAIPQMSPFTTVSQQSVRLLPSLAFCNSAVPSCLRECAHCIQQQAVVLWMPLPIKMLVMEVNIDKQAAA